MLPQVLYRSWPLSTFSVERCSDHAPKEAFPLLLSAALHINWPRFFGVTPVILHNPTTSKLPRLFPSPQVCAPLSQAGLLSILHSPVSFWPGSCLILLPSLTLLPVSLAGSSQSGAHFSVFFSRLHLGWPGRWGVVIIMYSQIHYGFVTK